MTAGYKKYFWKLSPFIRLLLPLIAGILCQWYIGMPMPTSAVVAAAAVIFYIIFLNAPQVIFYRYKWLPGLLLNILIFFAGVFLTWHKDVRNDANWFGKTYTDSSIFIIKIAEPPLQKERSFKADGKVMYAIDAGSNMKRVEGKVLIYFAREDSLQLPEYGDEILVNARFSRIKNSGNPAAFNYERYAGFQQIFHQVFLKRNMYRRLPAHGGSLLQQFIFWARSGVINSLKQYLPGDKKVTGIAEALLIGYKEDLDKDVVQEYSNTGVVHIIAISGMHLGLIYVVLVWLFSKIPFVKKEALLRVVLILACLWLFTLITGASASVMRSAVMFSCIITGKTFFKQATIYNALAASAFLLLCYDPFLLWDVGFQLSYFAVAGIVWLQRPIYNLFFAKNKYIMQVWKMCSITIAAQVLTFPICIYYFHQFPNLFLVTNLLAVPLSTVILFAEIFLIAFAWFQPLAAALGKLVYVLTWLMNLIINWCNAVPFSLLDKIYATTATTILLYALVFFICTFLLYKKKPAVKFAVVSLFLFSALWSYGKINSGRQKKVIVYNIARHRAIDFVSGNAFWFLGDEELKTDAALQNFHLKPARVAMQASLSADTLTGLQHNGTLWQFGNKLMLSADSTCSFVQLSQKLKIDVLLVSHNPAITMAEITSAVSPAVIVFDGSNSLWKIALWKKECAALHLRCHITAEDGSFILDVN